MALTTIATLVGIAGTVAGVAGQVVSYGAQKKAEKLRETQANLEAQRQRVQVVREANRQRSIIAAQSVQQGSNLGSGVAGATGQVTSGQNSMIQGINQSQEIGRGLFQANARDAFGRIMTSFGQGLSSLSGSLADSQDRTRRLTEYYGG